MGDPKYPLDPVEPGVPRVLRANFEIPSTPVGRRTALANWLTVPGNPLTARVVVNRIWQFRIGQGLIRTPNDFSLMEDRAANKALLDWLATGFVQRGWSIKAMDRMIVLSSAYRQISAPNAASAAVDVDNFLLWMMNRKRRKRATIRDAALSA